MTDQHAPATKQDLARLEARLDQMEKDLMRYFKVVAEDLTHDYRGIFKDRLEQHDDRIVRLEQHTGLRAA